MRPIKINKTLLLMKIHYFVGIGGYAGFAPFLTTLAKQQGYSAFVVGIIFMLQPIPGVLIRPIIGVITDKYKCRRSALIYSSIIIFMLVCLLFIMPSTASKEQMNDLDVFGSPMFWLFFGTITLINADGTVKNVLEETICMDLLGANNHNYGLQRLWGSIGYSILAIVSGACIDWFSKGEDYKNYTPGIIIALICFFLDIIVVSKIKVTQVSDTNTITYDVKKIFTQFKVLAFMLWIILFGFFIVFLWQYVAWYLEDLSNFYHPETKSWMKTLLGLSMIIRCFLGEGISFFLSSYILKHVEHMNVFSVMFFMFTVIFSLYSIIRDPVWALAVEFLNGITFAVAYATAISYAAVLSPAGAEGTLQGIVGMVLHGIGAPIGSFIGGYMFKEIGSIASFKILSVLALITCIAQIIINQSINRYYKNRDVGTESVATNAVEFIPKMPSKIT